MLKLFLTTFPKGGTTRLKALTFAIMSLKLLDFSQHPLLTKYPQECFPFLEVFLLPENEEPKVDISFA